MKNMSTVTSRLLAVIALGAAVVAVILVIGSATGGDSGPATGAKAGHADKKAAKKPKPKVRTYTVKAGDSLTAIAVTTGVPVDRIEQLNPDLDPQALTIGQKLKLR